jgi:hypothetical protein
MPKTVFIRAILWSPHTGRFLPFSWHVSQPLLAYGGRRHLLQEPWWWKVFIDIARWRHFMHGVAMDTCARLYGGHEVMGHFMTGHERYLDNSFLKTLNGSTARPGN